MDDKDFMLSAISQASLAASEGEVPVGAVIVRNGEIIATGRNRREYGKNALYHAEIEAIDNACKTLGGWRLPGCTLYVTMEPCAMCAGAIINSRIKKIYIGTMDEKTGAVGSVFNLFEDYTFNHKVETETEILKEECEGILKRFFKELRKIKNGG